MLCLWIEGVNIVKCAYYSKQSPDLIQSLPKSQWHFLQK